ncbi:uncharacterized protein CTRU02_207339 [Colletotrichum truncatum]|uniref:Uncharacterized protein n=1 Tax=Colletotrichum truncatum TaxID=5467 RepID=A0ACC3Z0J8_COLTU|nr:uncharacterized protein CTRU02_01025 [Colletotrichum truncatum]KAF6800620.1 hypothetical protein CTRU02_01025 [Colletotrichum truncatum]
MRCPGEQDPKKWGFKVDTPRQLHTPNVATRHACSLGSHGKVMHPRSRDGRHWHRMRRENKYYDNRNIGDDCNTHPRRNRRRTLLFDEFETFPRGPPYPADTPVRSTRDRDQHERRWDRRRWDGSEDMAMMHGAVVDDAGVGDYRRRRARSWERRSDPDDRVGEIDDHTEDSYGVGERMIVSRREDEGRRAARFGRI